MSDTTEFPTMLRAQLVTAAHRRRDRRRRTTAAVAAAACVLAAVAVVGALGATSDPAAAGVDVVVADGVATVRLVDVEYRPGYIEQEIREVGLDVDIVAVPVGPSNVGRFVGDTGDAPELTRVDADGPSFAGFALPVDWPGSLELQVGRPAEHGEPYAYASDAYATGEPLSCQGMYGRTAEDAVALLDDLGLEASFLPYAEGVSLPLLTPGEVAATPQRMWRVSDAHATSPERVVLVITADGRPPSAQPLNDDEGACHE
jgi:hypothetical protein